MSSSENRNSSAVRNLRSLFENKGSSTLDSSNSPDSRGRSPSAFGGSEQENGTPIRPTSKVRASFISVEPSGSVISGTPELERSSTAEMRRGIFSETNGEGELSEIKRTISEEQGRRMFQEFAVESAAATPMPKKPGEGQLGHVFPFVEQKEDQPPENPDKPVTGTEEEAGEMKPAEPTDEEAVSAGEALPPIAEDLRMPAETSTSTAGEEKAEAKKPVTNGKPAAISTKAASKTASTSVKSPASVNQPKTPTSATKASSSSTKAATAASPASKAPLKKASRTSLTAPTAASMAHTRPSGDKTSSTNVKTSPSSRPKPREGTKPMNLPSHLTAPTASSRAKHEPVTAPAPVPKTSTARAKQPPPSTSAKTSRSSFGPTAHQPQSRDSHAGGRRSTAAQPAEGSFLARMMKPTASSSSKTHEKAEPKSPPRQKAVTSKPKTNGESSKPNHRTPETSKAISHASPHAQRDHQDPPYEDARANDEVSALAATTHGAIEDFTGNEESTEITGNETPIPDTNGEASGAALEATPAALGSEETIR